MKSDNNIVQKFYDNFLFKLLKDYSTGNPRTVAAIQKSLKYIPTNSTQIIDIGCGIGWTSNEFARSFSSATILGVDLSPTLLKNAKTLFQQKNLFFDNIDITSEKLEFQNTFDAAILVDVYEHISISDRATFHSSLKNILNPSGSRVILTCPSVFHQSYLRNDEPDGLQPVDEDVDLATMIKLAEDLDGEIIHFEYQDIWHSFDYLHTVIEINPQYQKGLKIRRSSKKPGLEPRIERENRIKKYYPEVVDDLIEPVTPVEVRLTKKLKNIARNFHKPK